MPRLRKLSTVEVVQRLQPSPVRGKDGVDGVNGKDGRNGRDGNPGRDGKDGKDGITTVITKEVALDLSEYEDRIERLEEELKKLRRTTTSGGGGGKLFPEVHVVTGDINIGVDDSVIIFSSSGTANLPPKPRDGQHVVIKQGAYDAAITVEGNGNLIDGDTCQIINALGSSDKVFNRLDLIWANGRWYV